MKNLLITAAIAALLPLAASAGPDVEGIYKKNCLKCHGEGGAGDGKAAKLIKDVEMTDFTDAKWQKKRSDDEIVDAIANGSNSESLKLHKKMKPYSPKLSDEEIKALVPYIRAFGGGGGGEAKEEETEEKVEKKASSKKVEISDEILAAYKKQCLKCHGAEGKGDGKAAKLIKDVEMTDFTDAAWQKKRTDAEIVDAIANGSQSKSLKLHKKMKPYGEKLSEEEIEGLAAYVRSMGK